MKWMSRCLLLIIVAELLGSGLLVYGRLNRARPPEAAWPLLDPFTADDLRTAAATCESAKDWRTLGERYMAAGCFTESEMCHRVACEQEPRNAVFRRQWAFALERLGLLKEANTQYQKTMELDGTEADACHYFIGKNKLRAGEPSAAQTLFEDGKQLSANLYELARLQLRADDVAAGLSSYGQLTVRGSEMLQVNLLGYRLAEAQGDTGRTARFADRVRYSSRKLQNPFDEEAKRLVKATQQLGANRFWKQSEEFTSKGRLEEARKLLERLAEKDRNATVLELLAELALQDERFEDSLALFDELQQQFGPYPRITARIGDVLSAAGQFVSAHEKWLQAVQLQTGVDLKEIHEKLADSLATAGDEDAARRHRALAYYYTGRQLLHRNQASQAANEFQHAVETDSKLTQGWFYLGESKRLSRQPDAARDAYRTCLEQNPYHGRALASLSLLENK